MPYPIIGATTANFGNEFRQRTLHLIRAQYSGDWATLQNFARKYGVDFWLLEKSAFALEYLAVVLNR